MPKDRALSMRRKMKRRFLITGAKGFVGKHLCRELAARGEDFTCLVRSDPLIELPENYHGVDLAESANVRKVIKRLQPTHVVHLAASKDRSNGSLAFRDIIEHNFTTSMNVIDACRDLVGFQKFIFLGTSDEYGSGVVPLHEGIRETPTTAYGISKLLTSKTLFGLFRQFGFPSVVLRPSVIYGPEQGHEMFLPALIGSLVKGKYFPMTTGEQQRDFVYVADVVEAIIRSAESANAINGTSLNIGSGTSHQIKKVAIDVAKLIAPDAIHLLGFGALPYRNSELMRYEMSIKNAQEKLAWQPTTKLQHGLAMTVQFVMQQNYAESDYVKL